MHTPRASASSFQKSRVLAGAIYAESNAALALAQLGRDDEAEAAMRAVARRAPGSIDMRAALAANYWARGREARGTKTFLFPYLVYIRSTHFVCGVNRDPTNYWARGRAES